MTADALAPAVFLAVGLLLLAGGVKLARPHATAQALLDAGLPGSRAVARGIGTLELAIGAWALAAPAAGGAFALGSVYLVFAGFLGYVLRVHPESGSCGCAGPTPVPPSRLHLALSLIAGTAGLAYASTAAPSFGVWAASLGWVAVPVLAGMSLAGWLAVVAVSEAPAAFRSWEPPLHNHDAEPHGHDHAVADDELAVSGIGPGHPSLWPGATPGAG
ncbi:MAG: MauE/DoxX family redox-associated membrane protein [Actinomycetota bacterium]